MAKLLMHIYVTWPQWVKGWQPSTQPATLRHWVAAMTFAFHCHRWCYTAHPTKNDNGYESLMYSMTKRHKRHFKKGYSKWADECSHFGMKNKWFPQETEFHKIDHVEVGHWMNYHSYSNSILFMAKQRQFVTLVDMWYVHAYLETEQTTMTAVASIFTEMKSLSPWVFNGTCEAVEDCLWNSLQ